MEARLGEVDIALAQNALVVVFLLIVADIEGLKIGGRANIKFGAESLPESLVENLFRGRATRYGLVSGGGLG